MSAEKKSILLKVFLVPALAFMVYAGLSLRSGQIAGRDLSRSRPAVLLP